MTKNSDKKLGNKNAKLKTKIYGLKSWMHMVKI
jgi:hypothetical protein